MKSNYLKSELIKLQKEYCEVLKLAKPKMDECDFIYVLDEINLFWYSNRNKVELFLEYLFAESNCFIHTGASFIDIDRLEHFPFVMLGSYHLIDDPVANFGESLNMAKGNNKAFEEMLKKQIKLTIDQNIKIIENYSDIIQILPVRFLNISDREYTAKGSQNAFLNLFKDETLTIDRYFEEYKTIGEVGNGLLGHCKNLLIFNEREEKGSFEKRFKTFIDDSKIFQEMQDVTEGTLFYSITTGYFMQAFNILLVCVKYGLNPYLRCIIPFYNLNLLTDSMPKTEKLEDMLLNAKIAYLFYNTINSNDFEGKDFKSFYKRINEIGFYENLIQNINQNIENSTRTPLKKYVDIIEKELESILKYLKESQNITSTNI